MERQDKSNPTNQLTEKGNDKESETPTKTTQKRERNTRKSPKTGKNVSPPKKKPKQKKKYTKAAINYTENEGTKANRTFKEAWTEKYNWLDKNYAKDKRAYCKICEEFVGYSGGANDLKKHGENSTHIRNATKSAPKPQEQLDILLKDFTSHDAKVQEAEIRLAAWVAATNKPLNMFENFLPLLNGIAESSVIKDIKLGATKCTAVITNVLGQCQHNYLVDLMKSSMFSILIDESTDVSAKKSLCITIRIFDKERHKICDCFYDLPEATDASAYGLTNLILDRFAKDDIPFKDNLIGYCSDNANVVAGQNTSVAARLKQLVPNLFVLGCTSHSINLCAQKACTELPSYFEPMLRNIYSYIMSSPKRIKEFEKIQELLDDKILKILKLCETRWSATEYVTQRILSLHDPLKIYFGFIMNSDDADSEKCKYVYECLNDDRTLPLLNFLNFILPIVNNMNRLFQSESSQIFRLRSSMENLFRTVADCFIKDSHLKSLKDMSKVRLDPRHFKDLSEIYLGPENHLNREALERDMGTAKLEQLRKKCLNFFYTLSKEILKRFDFGSKQLKSMAALDPYNMINSKEHSNYPSLSELACLFPKLFEGHSMAELDIQYRQARQLDFSSWTKEERDNPDEFWQRIWQMKNNSGEPIFPALNKFSVNLFSLAHGNAAVERMFSQINLNKTKIRNRLSTKTIIGIMLTKDFVRRHPSYEIKLTSEMQKLLKSNNLYTRDPEKTIEVTDSSINSDSD